MKITTEWNFKIGLFLLFILTLPFKALAMEKINVLTWEGYVEPHEVQAVNKILKGQGYNYEINVISPWAEGPEQMFKILRGGKADISFLTLNYIQMQRGKTAELLQPINFNSPRFTNYKNLDPSMLDVPMGTANGKSLYLPFGGGAYGLWANMKKLSESDLPTSLNDLLDSKWTGKISLTKGQVQPNVAIASLMAGKSAFYLNDVTREQMQAERQKGDIENKLKALYKQVPYFWGNGPEFKDNLLIVASYGIGAAAENRAGGDWKLIKFKEGNTVWMDTINFHKRLKGKKLEAAEIFANYFIGDAVQTRVANELGMVSASLKHQTENDKGFFVKDMFWPPYKREVDNLMLLMSKNAM
ncbi:extracellular solute-binding protein [Vibrio sp. S4M6]|uniref:ABC transporter substrate-binding protein n=1 Tax=Vibrio sinus TaxID=2946865 RepID=UPI00202A9D63|nr:ABC transporter substrate-binding protein [Vibrio sinus]MCL9779882.1 extracellular solute-binding protein [Vibrio sinus]